VATKAKKKVLEWNQECTKAFQLAKYALRSYRVLAHPSSTAKMQMYTDASDFTLGAELRQLQNSGQWQPVAFFSKRLGKAERNYSTYDRELLAIYEAVKYFRHHIEGRVFKIFTDHKPLTTAMANAAERSPRQTRHLSFIAEFCTSLEYIKGPDNVVADALSRPEADAPAVESSTDTSLPASDPRVTGLA
jgi:cleavage and polyadenylation specificity factor subunit 1